MNKFLPFIMSGILALPTMCFAASSVRTLGGAGTYNGVTSVGSGAATRAGSIRAVPSVKVSNPSVTTSASTSGSTGTVSGNTGAGTRMSIGKYLSGSGVVSSKVSTSAAATELADDISGLTSSLDDLAKQVDALEKAGYITLADLSDDNDPSKNYLTEKEIKALSYIDEAELDNALAQYKTDTLDPTYATKQDLESIDVAGTIADALDGYATKKDLGDYATNDDLDDLSTSAGKWIDKAVGDAKDALNARIDSVEAGIPSFEIYSGPFDPEQLDTGN